MVIARPSARKGTLVALGALLLLGFGLRIFLLGAQSLWYDEAYSLSLAQRDFVSLTRATAEDIHPPLYYYALKLWVAVAGHSEFAARYLSLGFGILLVPASYVLGRRLVSRKIALATAALAAVSPLYVYYSQETRMYTLFGLLTTLAVSFFLKACAGGRMVDWTCYVLCMAAALYTHLYAALIFAFLNGVLLGAFILQRPSRAAIRDLARRALPQAIVAVLFLPWMQVAITKYLTYTSPAGGSTLEWVLSQTAIVMSLGHSVLGITTFPGQPDYAREAALALALSAPFVILAGLAGATPLYRRTTVMARMTDGSPGPGALLFGLAYVAIPLFLITLLSFGRRDFNPRYLFAAAPGYYLLIAAGLAVLAKWQVGKPLVALVTIVFVAAWGYALGNYYFTEKYHRDDFRAAVAYVRGRALPDDLVVLDASFDAVYQYYAGSALPWVRFPKTIPPDPESTVSALPATVAGHSRVWLVEWGDYYEDPQRVVQRWLDRNAFRMDARAFQGPIIVYGYLTSPPVVIETPRPAVVISARFGDDLALLGYDLKRLEGGGVRRIHLTTYWQALRKLDTDYSIFAQLFNPAGKMLGLGDSQPVNGYLPTTAWQPGQIVRSEMDVAVYPAAPPMDYDLLLGVYDQSSMRRLPVEGRDVFVLGTVRFEQPSFSTDHLDYERAAAVQFGDSIQLIGYRLSQTARQSLHLTLFWRALGEPTRRFTVFNHLVDSAQRTVSQQDGEPAGGAYPTSIWRAGEVVRDDYDIPVPSGLAGEFRLLTGLYLPDSGERLTVRDWLPVRRKDSAFEIGRVRLGP